MFCDEDPHTLSGFSPKRKESPYFLPMRFALLFLACTIGTRGAETVSIAAAANLVYVLDDLNAEFKRSASDIVITTATGASGSLVAQIRNGAPYDVFLSADLDFPLALVQAGQADAKSLVTFAVGRLVLWTARSDLELTELTAAVRNPTMRKLAIANPKTAPYGRAAQQTLEKLGLWSVAQPKLVLGENITQTAQFVETGNADAGFVAMSLVCSPRLRNHGRWLEIPAYLHAPLAHGAVLTSHGATNSAAGRYLAFLHSAAARKILERFGYSVPEIKPSGT